MMKNFKISYPVLILTLISLFWSCAKDKGNYSYTTLDPVTINLTGIPTSYAMLRFDYLDIKPVVTYKGQTVDPEKPQFPELSFSWDMYPSQANSSIIEKNNLGKTQNLHYQMTEKEITWEVLFTVTNTNTGVKTFAKFAATITPALAEGWMVLYERNGNTDVGIIANNEITKAASAERLFMDVYEASNGAPLNGTPGSIIYSKSGFPTLVALYIQSSKDIVNVNTNTFAKIGDSKKGMFWTNPEVIAPTFVTSMEGRKDFVINNNRLHNVDYTLIANGDRAFGDALGGSYGTLAPWMPTATLSSAFDAIVYDQTNKKFMKVARGGVEVVPLSTQQSAAAAFDVSNVGLEFVAADLGWNNWEHIVMKNNASNYYLLTANFREGETALIGKGKYDMNNCPEIAALSSVAAGANGEIFYYSANSSLYQFKYTPGTTDKLWAAPSNEKITSIALQKYNTNTNRGAGVLYDPKNFCKILYVATYNEATKIGSVYQMEVNVTSGALVPGTEKKYTGFGKVKTMAWKLGIK